MTLSVVCWTTGLSIKSCHSPAAVFSSCHRLLGSTTVRRAVFLLALMSLTGNLASLGLRHGLRKRRTKTNDVPSVFVPNLNVCNCLMGVYLTMLAVADQLQGGDYLWRERAWRSSSWCFASGFLFFLSTEVSVFTVTVATLERCWVLSRACGNVKTRKASVLLCVVCWIVGIVLATVPAARTSFSSSGACIPSLVALPGHPRVHRYTIGVLVVLNGICMIVTAVGQAAIYATVCRNEMVLTMDRKGSQDLIIALRMMAVSITDACSWFLLLAFMLLTSHGVLTSVDVSFTSTLLAMVTKPCVNPYLYFFSAFLERRRQTQRQRLMQWLRKNDTTDKRQQ